MALKFLAFLKKYHQINRSLYNSSLLYKSINNCDPQHVKTETMQKLVLNLRKQEGTKLRILESNSPCDGPQTRTLTKVTKTMDDF